MLPAHEGFDAGDDAVLQAYGRLVVQHELPLRDRGAQFAEGDEPARGVVAGAVVVPDPATGPLGRVHRRVGLAQQLVGLVAVTALQRQPHADGDPQLGAQ